MSYYKYDKEKLDKIKKIDGEISKLQQQIFDILLKISQSFSDENFSKEKRNEMFEKVDSLKNNIKEYNEQINEIKLLKTKEIVKESSKNDEILEKVDKSLEKIEKKNEEFVNTAQKLEETLKENLSENQKIDLDNFENKNEKNIFKRKKSRTQLIVIEDDDSFSGKIKVFFNKLRNIIKK